jgi:peptidoglycan/xylan/chitin deacetylase (PgdA/CDA1 family)
MITPRLCALYILRAAGVFAVAKYLTRKQLRILCYHSFSVGDEHQVNPVMFMRAHTFEQRMQILQKRRVAVITLDEAVGKLRQRAIRNAETVITLDDGWVSNLTIGAPILEKYGYPACIYTSTEHLEAGTEVFNVALSYMVRRSGREALTLVGLHPHMDGTYEIGKNPDAAIVALIGAAERSFPLAERQQLLRPIARALGADVDEVLRDGRFRLLSRSEMQQAFRRGLDIQLHTHTHHLPDSSFGAMAEAIIENRRMIADVIGVEPRHFCYPSGQFSEQHPEWLQRLGIASATTCNPGLNGADTPVMLLNRILDSDRESNIVFEAEICGVYELARRLRRAAMRAAHRPRRAHSLSGLGSR